MTTYTPQQAREMTTRAIDHGTMAGVVKSLADQVDLLAAICGQYERNYKQDERDMVKLTAECDAIKVDAERYRLVIERMKQEAETGGLGDEQMMRDACEEISRQGIASINAARTASS